MRDFTDEVGMESRNDATRPLPVVLLRGIRSPLVVVPRTKTR
jgi:hypothetical protein